MSVDDDGPPPPAPMLARRPTRDLPPLPIETNFNELVLFVEEETVECTVGPQNISQSPVEMTTDTEPSSLTPLQAHYLTATQLVHCLYARPFRAPCAPHTATGCTEATDTQAP